MPLKSHGKAHPESPRRVGKLLLCVPFRRIHNGHVQSETCVEFDNGYTGKLDDPG